MKRLSSADISRVRQALKFGSVKITQGNSKHLRLTGLNNVKLITLLYSTMLIESYVVDAMALYAFLCSPLHVGVAIIIL